MILIFDDLVYLIALHMIFLFVLHAGIKAFYYIYFVT